VKESITAREAIVAHFVSEAQAEAILAELRPWLWDPPPIDQFREQLEATVEPIWAIHRVAAHYRAADEAFRQFRLSAQRAKTALQSMQDSAAAPEMANFVGLLKLDDVRDALVAVNELESALSHVPAAFSGQQEKRTKGPRPRAWYSGFVRDCVEIAEWIGLPVTTGGRRDGDPKATPFTTLVFEVEKFLPRNLRSNSAAACAKQIDRAIAASASEIGEQIARTQRPRGRQFVESRDK
jgi:hypothetical protein